MKTEKGAADKRFGLLSGFFYFRNRHSDQWRFLLFASERARSAPSPRKRAVFASASPFFLFLRNRFAEFRRRNGKMLHHVLSIAAQ
ncbi:MAG: hypothetical protein HPZ79_08695 [Oscillospiraceae bacterium]|nr:hypothetical protein [Oscillospiraceae bacterium]